MNLLTKIANSFSRIYHATPAPLRWVWWLLPFIYLLLRIDFLPDFIRPFGVIDDLLFGLFILWAIGRSKHFKDFFRDAFAQAKGPKDQRIGEDEPQFENRDPFDILGISRDASHAQIKAAYLALMKRYHPDKFAHLGPEFEKTARAYTQAINQAYQQLSN